MFLRIYSYTFITAIFLIFSSALNGQYFASNQAEYDSIYAVNITLSKINGIYIPSDIDDAHKVLIQLTPTASMRNFKTAEEIEVCKKLHFGIGRWMIVNWNFYEGSRLSHVLKEIGLLHPDDMANFLLRTLHRKLNHVAINQEEIIEQLAESRKKEAAKLIKK